jgi:(2R)-3-sulfolactate dehydrogenase (NADP+)
MSTTHFTLEAAHTYLLGKFLEAGVPEPVAQSVTTALVQAEAEGQGGHGFSRVNDYIAQFKSGKINPNAEITCEEIYPAALRINADSGFAYPAVDMAITRGVDAANAYGIASVSISHSHHCGALSYHVERIAKAGMIGIMVANTPKAMAPWGGSDALFGTNPIAFGVPRAGQDPLVIDLSLSTVARGKVVAAQKKGEDIPLGWALDAEGNPTTDPNEALKGTMTPLGGAKGSALALMVEILAAVHTGSSLSKDAGSFFNAEGDAPNVGQFLIILKPMEGVGIAQRLADLLQDITDQEGARLPGLRRLNAYNAAHEKGIFVANSFL